MPPDDEDAELAAIRARLRQELLQQASAPAAPSPPAAPAEPMVPDLEEAQFEAFVRANENVVVDCWAPWYGPCRIVGPIIEELAREMTGRVRFAKLNTDLSPRVSQALGIMSIPTLLVFRRGQLLDRIVGAHPKPKLAALLDRHFGRRAGGAPGPRRM